MSTVRFGFDRLNLKSVNQRTTARYRRYSAFKMRCKDSAHGSNIYQAEKRKSSELNGQSFIFQNFSTRPKKTNRKKRSGNFF